MEANLGISVNLTGKEWGQLKTLKEYLGDITQDVIEWIVDPVNWFFFCQQIRADWKTNFVPNYPHIGFLLARRGSALRVMRSQLSNSGASSELQKLEQPQYEQIKTLLLTAYAYEKPGRLAKIQAATTLADMHKVFIEILDESKAESTTDLALLKNSA